MRRIRFKAYVPRVEAALRTFFPGAKVVFHEEERVYIVRYQLRNIAFAEDGRLLAVGTNPSTIESTFVLAQQSHAILRRVDDLDRLLRPRNVRC